MSRDIGQYKIFNEIGKGSFGKVYKGLDKLSGEQVALKFIEKKQKRSRDLKNLREQNQLLKKINHSNVISLKDVIETPKEIIIVTDYAGRDLSGVIQEVKKFTLEKVKDYSLQILNAMLYLNQNRIIHRDLKPQNILIKDNHIKICDFGFAKKLSASTNFLQSMKGTPLYLAPEIVRQTKYTEKVDIWSFGCIIYELFTGRTPYYANTYQKLAPLILYQQVQYPKQMPAELKDLISSMLQKNPSARPDWKQLKNHGFFKQTQVLKQKIQNGLKQVVSIQIPDKTYISQKSTSTDTNKQNNKIPNKQQNFLESKVIQKIQNQNELKSYQEEFKKIYTELMANKIDSHQLSKDIIFLHKIKTVFHERSQLNPLITNELLESALNIIEKLIKIKKGSSNNQNMAENQKNDEDDITKNEALIFGILCLAKVEKNYVMLEKQLYTLCKLVKRNFNEIAVNSEIDEEITEFVTEILLENSANLPLGCIRNGLLTIGTMVNQAVMTLHNSYSYFQKVAEDNLLNKIAKLYSKDQKCGTVLQLLKSFIHPVREIKTVTGANPHHLIYFKMQKVFQSLKEEVAQALLKTDFLSQVSPLDIYEQKSPMIINYCQVLLQCLQCSPQARKQFLKYNYWMKFLESIRLRSFLFAYNSIFINLEEKSIIPNEDMAKYMQKTQQNKITSVSIFEMCYLRLKGKLSQADSTVVVKYKKFILEKVSNYLFTDEAIKLKCCRQIYGILETSSKNFDQPLIQIFFNVANGLKPIQNCDEYKDLAQLILLIFKKTCNPTNPFKPNTRSLYNLMTLFTDSQIIKNLKLEKPIQQFFYQCINDFITRQDCEYLENELEEKQINSFIAKMIQCLNWLIEIEEIQNKTSSFSQNALNLTKLVVSSGFYRFMFIDGLTENHFYEHLKYSQKIISKTAQVQPQFINFLGVKVIPMCKNYIQSKSQPLLSEMFHFMAPIARDHSQFNHHILETGIIKRFKQWLCEEKYSEYLKEKVLYLIGNLAKRSDFFFGQFQTYSVIEAIAVCLKNFYMNAKIFKNTIYAVGNISFYSQKFYKEIDPMIPYFAKVFEMNDSHLKNNLISTISNLMRFSNIYLSQLIKTGLITNILKIACQSPQIDQTIAGLIMSLIKKIVPYDEFYQAFGFKDLKIIYQKRQQFGGDTNETIRKIKEILVNGGELS